MQGSEVPALMKRRGSWRVRYPIGLNLTARSGRRAQITRRPPPPRPNSSLSRLYDRTFLVSFLCQVSFVLANTLVAHYARWVTFLRGDAADVGLVMGVAAVAGLALRPWLGQWINRWGARATWMVGFLLFGVGTLGSLALDHVGFGLFLARALIVAGAAFAFSSQLTYITLTTPADRRTEAIGVAGAGGFVAMLIGPYLGDLILGAGERSRTDFVVLFITTASILIVPAILVNILRAPDVEQHRGATRLKDFVRIVREHWPGMILMVDAAFGLCLCVPFVFLPNFVDVAGLKTPGLTPIGWFFVGYAGVGLCVRLLLRRLPDRAGRRKVLLVGLVFAAGGLFSFLGVDAASPMRLLVPACLCGTAHALMFFTMIALTLEPFPPEVRGSGSALALMLVDFGTLIGAPLLGQLAASLGYQSVFITAGTVALVAAALYTGASIPVWRARWKAKVEGESPVSDLAPASPPAG